jgi:hypothetical protein
MAKRQAVPFICVPHEIGNCYTRAKATVVSRPQSFVLIDKIARADQRPTRMPTQVTVNDCRQICARRGSDRTG